MRLSGIFFLVVCSVLTLASQVWAFESFPEFQSLNPSLEMGGPENFNSEYSSDALAFTKPYDWQYQWISHSKAFDLSVGSLSATRFLMNNRLKVYEKLTEKLEFRFSYMDLANYEDESQHAILEFVYWPWQSLGLSFYGGPSTRKSEDDIGAALLVAFDPHHVVRVFFTAVDFSRNERNTKSDRFEDSPYSVGFVGRAWSPFASGRSNFVQYYFRYEGETRWRFPDENKELFYYRRRAGLALRQRVLMPSYVHLDLEWDRRKESYIDLNGNALTDPKGWKRDQIQTLAQWEQTVSSHGKWIGGVKRVDRMWTLPFLGTLRQVDWLPHLWWEWPFERSWGQDSWSLGYEATQHRTKGDTEYGPAHDKSQWEQRANLVYEFGFKEKASLRLLFSFDLDRFGTGETWEGGNGQFSMWF